MSRIEGIAIAEMLFGPRLTIGGFGLADNENRDLGLLRDFNGRSNAFLLRGRIR